MPTPIRSLVLLPLAGVLWLPAVASGQRSTTLEVRASRDGLSDGFASWQEQAVALRHRASTRSGAGFSLERLERFGLEDRRLAADVSLGVGRRVTLGVEGEGSPTHRVAARSGGAGRLHLSLGAGWGVEGRATVRRYDAATARGFTASLERYWSRFLASYAVAPIRLSGSDATGVSHQLRFTTFVAERGSVTLGGSTGREVENLGGGQVLAMNVRSASAWGVLPLGARVDATWAAGLVRQGDLFTRTHLSLGLRAHLR